jgi:hypothetical protein
MFKKGDKVKWKSQSGGSTTEKKGVIVRIVESPQRPYEIAEQEFPNHKRMFDGWMIPSGSLVAYFVEARDGKTAKAKPKLYMPLPQKLQHDNK